MTSQVRSLLLASAALLLGAGPAYAGTVSVEGGVVTAVAEPHEFTGFVVTREAGAFIVQGTSLVAGPGCEPFSYYGPPTGVFVRCADAGVASVRITLGNGSTTLNYESGGTIDVPLTVQGGTQRDQIAGGGTAPSSLYGGDGDDYLRSWGPADDLLDGGPGNDEIWVGPANSTPRGRYTLIGGPGDDDIDAPFGLTGMRVDCGAGRDAISSSQEPVAPGNVLTEDCPPVVIVKPTGRTQREPFVRARLAGNRLKLRLRLSEPARGAVLIATGGRRGFRRATTNVPLSIRLASTEVRRLRAEHRRRGHVFARVTLRDRSGEPGGATLPLRIRG